MVQPLFGLMILIVVVVILSTLFDIVTPLLSGKILDEVIFQAAQPEQNLSGLISLLLYSFGATLLYLVLRSTGQRLGDHLAGKVRQYLTEMFYRKALTLPQSYYDSEMSGKILNQLNRGIATIQDFTNTTTNFIIPIFFQGIIVIGILAFYNLALAGLMLAIFPIYILLSRASTKRWGKREEKKNKIEDLTRSRIQEVIANIKLVKGFTNEKAEFKTINKNLVSINDIYRKQSNEYHLFDFFRELSLYIILFGTMLIIFYNAFTGAITVGTVIVLIQLVDRARQPLFGMSYVLGQIQAAESGSKEFIEILDLKSQEDFETKEQIVKVQAPKIKFEQVAFHYKDSEEVFADVSFTAQQNEIVALVGPSGAGKTTIANLILKFYNPSAGKIYLNGQDYETLSHKFVRENIALVFQENELFSSTVLENVAYGSELDEAKATTALKKANAWDFVSHLPKGIHTEVGERGIKLSGGQRQRVQIARAIYKDAPILILDEATSSLDAKSESEVSEALSNLVKDKLVIIIAHRFSTIQNATKVIVLNEKRVEAIGSPQELSHKKGIYADLLQYQIDGNKKLLKKFEIY